ncbi:MAG: prepilin-type N-terminal cleavage/methylation domain-containing protein [Planctomycetota bacterium]|jgi:prepilin-type N-terminal cleavage/methylation domain-containing protein
MIRRGLTMLELMLALTITGLVAAAISSTLGAMTRGITTRQDNRSVLIRGNAARVRLCAYIAPARALLEVAPESVVVWCHDARESGTVHATEVRWLVFDAANGVFEVQYVDFPDGWTQAAIDVADKELAAQADWWAILDQYAANGTISSFTLVDGLDAVAVSADSAAPCAAKHVSFDLTFRTDTGGELVRVPASLRFHAAPSDL